ncbi:MAG TPA: DUF72 domain-containing protein [Candidatus Kapabacteria bacterium]|nr:DUF72 domain-containing protein [Candidatus Kapabacteria bacterium]
MKFNLPADHPITAKVLGGKKRKGCRIYVGCPVWSEPKLVGRLYPKGTKPKDFLTFYSRQFNAIELNASGYGMPTDEETDQWLSEVPPGFVFCPKVPPRIAKTRPLGKNEEAFAETTRAMHRFGAHLGPALLQLHPTFKPDRADDLLAFLEKWDKTIPLHVELRHEAWFDGSASAETLIESMRKMKIGSTILQTSGRRDVCHMALTTPSAFIRFDGHDLHKTDFQRLNQWTDRVTHWIESGLESLYFFVHTPKYELNPQLAYYFIESLNKKATLTHPLPHLLVTKGK